MIFFSYYKEEINLCDLFYIIQKLGDDIFFLSFQVRLNFLIKTYLFLSFKNVFKKKLKFFYFFLYFKLIFFLCFVSFWCDDIKNKNILLQYIFLKKT